MFIDHGEATHSLPSEHVGDVVGLLDGIEGVSRMLGRISEQMTLLTGLRLGELQTLRAISDGYTYPRVIAERTGQVTEAATATADALQRRGLVALRTGVRPGQEFYELTGSGTATLAQVEGLEIRLLDEITSRYGLAWARGFNTRLGILSKTLEKLPETPQRAELGR